MAFLEESHMVILAFSRSKASLCWFESAGVVRAVDFEAFFDPKY